MESSLANEIVQCLPRGRTMFRYYRQRYALLLLKQLVGEACPIAALRASQFKSLLQLPPVKTVLADCGDGLLRRDDLELADCERGLPFLLTLDLWGGNLQTSRRGVNLVLQLNFSNHHDRPYRKLVKPQARTLFHFAGHPIMRPGRRELFRETLAWSRIDLDFDCNEALIEEIQCDWVRASGWLGQWLRYCRARQRELPRRLGVAGEPAQLDIYLRHVIRPYLQIWDEAMLAATLDFLGRELGIDTVYMHEFDTGCRVKRIRFVRPPRSLYTRLPRRFCFRLTEQAPRFLLQTPAFARAYRQLNDPCWFRLDRDLGENSASVAA